MSEGEGARLGVGEKHTNFFNSFLSAQSDELSFGDVAAQLKQLSIHFNTISETTSNLNSFCQTISTEVPRIYQILNQPMSSYDLENVKSALFQVSERSERAFWKT